MKRADIHVGDELFYRRGKYGDGQKAIAVDTERYASVDSWRLRRGEPSYVKDPKGNLILVDIPAWGDTNRMERHAVTLANLLGPYEQVKAEEDAQRKADREHGAARQAVHDAQKAETNRLIALSASLGLAEIVPQSVDYRLVAMPATTLAVLLEAYAARTT